MVRVRFGAVHPWNVKLPLRVRPAQTRVRRCVFEHMEPRVMLAADVALSGQMPSIDFTGGQTGSISGSVFAAAANEICAAHDAAHGMDQVQVQLLDETGTVVMETTTDESGAYQFDELIPGEYSLRTVAIGGEALLDAQQLDQIAVQGGLAMTDYDFCHFATLEENRADSGDQSTPLASVLALAGRNQPESTPTFSNPALNFVASTASFLPVPSQQLASSAEVYGGSSRALKSAGSIKSWDEFQWGDWPVDSLFSTIQFLDLTGAKSVGLATLDAIYGQAEEAIEDFADRYTSESLDWCDCEDDLEVQDVLGAGDSLPEVAELFAEQPIDVPKVASRVATPANQ